MRQIDQTLSERPSCLDEDLETSLAYKELKKNQEAADNSAAQDSKPKFKFTAYGKPEVRAALGKLSYGKCAYCEKRFAATQPVDVEHWRPKSQVETATGEKKLGYYWLAARWNNLLPSCIDCNRRRKQIVYGSTTPVNAGKQDQFPVLDERKRWKDPDQAGEVHETPLLLNPYTDDPADFLEYDDEGFIHPKQTIVVENMDAATAKKVAEESIRIYALNRNELVQERLLLIKRIERLKLTVTLLMELMGDVEASRTSRLSELILELIDREIEHLTSLCRPEAEFSALARARVDAFISQLSQ